MTTSADTPAHGAYGLTLDGFTRDPAAIGLVPVPDGASAPRLLLRRVPAAGERPPDHDLTDDSAVLLLIEQEWATMDRVTGEVVFHTHHEISDPDLVHPYLAAPAGVIAQWHGRTAFHAGGIVAAGGAWAVLGDKEAGKTTTLAHLHRRGVPVVADDLVVLDGATAFAGPRCLDLRSPTVPTLGDAAVGEMVRAGDRFRLTLPPLDWSMPFRGCVVLEVADEIEVIPVGAAQRLNALTPQWMWGERDAVALLDVVAAPMFVLRRPLRWDALPEALDVLLEALQSA